MSAELTPLQRLAISRSQLAHALLDPVWLMLLQRFLKEKPPS
jgi:hypothetical protein